MRLKSITLFGFKSFAERQVFDLGAGLTAIVGPNGCGKSNVVDAVKWVLGEQRAKSLRGAEMTDVIFNGSEKRAPVDVAEVSLRFDNSDGALPIPEVEVEVCRRLHRSGESEYLINRRSCRLKDVKDLFLGTGLGSGGYSFMEQGKIDSVLAGNPVERRKVFEEAAGISRFRARRHETELKLDKVDANLLRLADIVEELSRQQRSLKVQAGKANSYKELSGRARELQVQVALNRYDRAQKATTEIEAEFQELVRSRDETTVTRDQVREVVETVRADLEARSQELAACREQVAGLAAREKGARDLADFHQRHLATMQHRAEDRRREIEQLEKDVEQSLAERTQLEADAGRLGGEVAARKEELDARDAELQKLRSETRALEEAAGRTDLAVTSLQRKQLEGEREIARLDAEEGRWKDETQRAAEALENLQREVERLIVERGLLEGKLQAAAARSEAARSSLQQAERSLEAAEAAVQGQIESQRQLVQERSRIGGRIDALEGHIVRQEGLDAGVKAVLAERKKRPEFLKSTKGLLIDLFRTDLATADAFESALGEIGQAIVVETLEEALEGAAWVAGAGRGRAAFLPLEAFPAGAGTLPEGLRPVEERYRPVFAALLEGVGLMEASAVESAIREKRALPPLVVTPQGGLVREGRVFVAGSKSGQRGQVAVRAELEKLKQAFESATEKLAALEKDLVRSRETGEAARKAMRAAREGLQAEESAAQKVRVEFDGLERRIAGQENERRRLDDRGKRAASELATIAANRERSRAAIDALAAELSRHEAERAARNEERRERREALELAQADNEARRIALATDRQRLEGLKAAVRHLGERHDQAKRAIARYAEELSGYAGDREKSEESARLEREKAEGIESDLKIRRSESAQLESRVLEVRAHFEENSRRLRDIEAALAELAEGIHGREMRLGEIRVMRDGLIENVRNELDLDLVQIHAEYVPLEMDWATVEEELKDLREKIRRLGNVNLAAIDDLEQVEERLEFLTAQRNDLLHSKQQLSRVLSDIEAESTRLFLDTFTRVRDQFQNIFRKLFGGGRADIALIDEEHPLESGIEITAKPPGKEARSISLLSGGERTLTAVSLLFSIISAHPCPCCLLDEVDAALDEDNTERFCRLLDEFTGRTQFILITHSRRTMARADTLFGVTMGERGVSRRVGVRFEDVHEDGSFVERGETEPPRGPEAGSGGGEGRSGGSSSAGPRNAGDESAAGDLGADRTPPLDVLEPSGGPLMGEAFVGLAAEGLDESGGRVGRLAREDERRPRSRRSAAAKAGEAKESEAEA